MTQDNPRFNAHQPTEFSIADTIRSAHRGRIAAATERDKQGLDAKGIAEAQAKLSGAFCNGFGEREANAILQAISTQVNKAIAGEAVGILAGETSSPLHNFENASLTKKFEQNVRTAISNVNRCLELTDAICAAEGDVSQLDKNLTDAFRGYGDFKEFGAAKLRNVASMVADTLGNLKAIGIDKSEIVHDTHLKAALHKFEGIGQIDAQLDTYLGHEGLSNQEASWVNRTSEAGLGNHPAPQHPPRHR